VASFISMVSYWVKADFAPGSAAKDLLRLTQSGHQSSPAQPIFLSLVHIADEVANHRANADAENANDDRGDELK
jgi:hypothetical protein